jgi:hypothetical protein
VCDTLSEAPRAVYSMQTNFKLPLLGLTCTTGPPLAGLPATTARTRKYANPTQAVVVVPMVCPCQ